MSADSKRLDVPESDLISGLRSGNKDAFEQIFRKYHILLRYTARGYFHDEYLVDEVIADVFAMLWQKRVSIEVCISLKNYLIRAVINKCTDYYRKRCLRQKLMKEINDTQELAYTLVDLGEDPLEYTITHELEQRLTEAVESLPERTRQAFKLSRYTNMTYDEIAVEMGITKDGVKLNIKKALSHLREKLGDFLYSLILVLLTIF